MKKAILFFVIYAYIMFSASCVSASPSGQEQTTTDSEQYNEDTIENESFIESESSTNSVFSKYFGKSEKGSGTNQTDTSPVPQTDFFEHISKEDYNNYSLSGQYDTIYTLANNYITEYSPPENDNAYIIVETLKPVMEVWESIEVVYDDFENSATFYYSGVKEITDKYHFIPYATTIDKNIFVLAGFYNNDWIFFDELYIKSTDDPIRFYSSYNSTRDIMDGGNIYEAGVYDFSDEEIKEFNQLDTHTVRFSGDDDKKLDFQLSPEEEQAFDAISRFWNVRNILSDVAFHYYNPDSNVKSNSTQTIDKNPETQPSNFKSFFE